MSQPAESNTPYEDIPLQDMLPLEGHLEHRVSDNSNEDIPPQDMLPLEGWLEHRMSNTSEDVPPQGMIPLEGWLEHRMSNTSNEDVPPQDMPPLEGDLEHRMSNTSHTSTESASGPKSHDEEAEIGTPATRSEPPPPDQVDEADQGQDTLFNLPRWRKWALLICSCTIALLLQYDMAAVAVILHKIAKDTGAPQFKTFALATGYLLAQTVFQLVFSHVAHAVGTKFMYMLSVTLYLVGASGAATGPNINALIGLRVIQGIGAAGIFSMSAVVLVKMTLPRQRAGWVSISQAFGAVGNICGPAIAALLCWHAHFSWASVFAVEAIIAAGLLISLALLLPSETPTWHDRLRKLKNCDWIGLSSFFTCAIGILVPIMIGGTTETLRWGSAPIITCFVVGILSGAFLIYHERRVTGPAFPREVFARLATNVAFIGSAVCGLLLMMVFYSLVLFWEGVREKSTIEVGKMLLSVTLTYPTAFAITGISIRRWGRIQPAVAVGALLSTLALGLMQLLTEDAPEAALLFICALAGTGCGVLAPAMVSAVVATTPPRCHADAIASRALFYTTGTCIGVSLGLAIFSGAFRNRFEAFEGDAGLRAAIAKTAIGNPQELLSQIKDLRSLAPRGELVTMVVGALRAVWAFACVLAGVTGAIAVAVRFPDLAED